MNEIWGTLKSTIVIAAVVLTYCAAEEGQTAAAWVTVVAGVLVLLFLQRITGYGEGPISGRFVRLIVDNRSVGYLILMATMVSSYRDWSSAAFNLALRLLPMVLIEVLYAYWRENKDLRRQREYQPTSWSERLKFGSRSKAKKVPIKSPQPAVVLRAPRKKLKGYPYKDKEEAPSN